MRRTLRSGNHDEEIIGKARRRGEKRGRDRDRLRCDEKSDGWRDVRILRKSCDRLTPGVFRGSLEEGCEEFRELPQLTLSRMSNVLEAGDGRHQNNVLLPQPLGFFQFPKAIDHDKTLTLRKTDMSQTRTNLLASC
ncbi:hypothetical protein [Ciceribacter ferrooxidans]|uniref:hypothetical protein n=1 Tax=Ciceribacter ferrooxidans TaxID=2509717 RepID=UPI003F6E1537